MGIRDRLKSALGLGPHTHLEPGAPAPELGVRDGQGRAWTLTELRGAPFVVYFYPKDDTPGCTREACDFRDGYGRLTALGARLFGVSADDARAHGAFAQKFNLPFPLLIDGDGAMARRWGAAGGSVPRRVTFLVDGDGRVARVWDPVKVEGHAAEVLGALDALPPATTAR